MIARDGWMGKSRQRLTIGHRSRKRNSYPYKAQINETMGDMRTLGTGVEMYMVDYGDVPAAKNIQDLLVILRKDEYIRELTGTDTWDNDFIYEFSPENEEYFIISTGKNGIREAFPPYEEDYAYNYKVNSDFDDTVFVISMFYIYPRI